ncbi:MAG: hypothetical protein AAF585_22575, partial [Verrucomicrobiota bacterium]
MNPAAKATIFAICLVLAVGDALGDGLGKKLQQKKHDEHAEDEHHGRGLELSEEVVPYEELGDRVKERDELMTEKLEDALFSSNRERKRRLKERSLDDVETEIPDRKTIFGKGDRFLSTGPTSEGTPIGTGATWRPYWLVWG